MGRWVLYTIKRHLLENLSGGQRLKQALSAPVEDLTRATKGGTSTSNVDPGVQEDLILPHPGFFLFGVPERWLRVLLLTP
jgi:hypothetical protein